MKKYFVLFLVVVLILGFAACDKRKPVGTALAVESSPVDQIIRGEVSGRATTYGSWAFIEVCNPADDLSYGRYTKMVLLERLGMMSGLNQVTAHQYKVGDEIYFTLCWPTGHSVPVSVDNLTDYKIFGLQVNLAASPDNRIINPKK